RGMRLYRDAQRIFLFVIAEAAPGRGVLREDDGPLIRGGKGVQAVGAGGQRVAFDRYVVGKGDGRVFVGARAPHLAVGDGLAPDFASAHERPAIVDGDIRQPDALRGNGALADGRKTQLYGLPSVFELRPRDAGETADGQRKARTTIK